MYQMIFILRILQFGVPEPKNMNFNSTGFPQKLAHPVNKTMVLSEGKQPYE